MPCRPTDLTLGRETTPRGERRQHQTDQARKPGDAGHDERGSVDSGLDAHAGGCQRTDRIEQLQGAERDPWRGKRGRDDEHEALEERHPGHVPGGRPAGAEHGRLDATLIDEQPGHQHERVGGQDDELDRQQQHAGAAHQQRSIGVLEDLRQAGRHAEECGVSELGTDPALERGGVAAQPANVLQRQVVKFGERAPAHVQLTGRHAIDQVASRDDQRPMDGERRPLADAGELQPVSQPVPLGRVVRLPDADDPDLDDALLSGTARQGQLVADAEAKLVGRAGRHCCLERLGTGSRPRALHDGRVLHQAIGGRKHRHVRLRRIGDGAGEVVGAGLDRARQLAIGPAQDAPRLTRDHLVDGRQLGRFDAHLDVDAGGGGRRRGQRLAEATQRDGIAVQDADGQQRRGAHDDEPGGEDDEPVGDASLQDNAQRGQRALEHPDPPLAPTRPTAADRFTMP